MRKVKLGYFLILIFEILIMRYNGQIPQLNFDTPTKTYKSDVNEQISSHSQPCKQNESQQQGQGQKMIKNYIIGQTIGQGTFNKVKIARHILTNQKVAVKMIQKSSIQTQADTKRLNLQLKILRKVRHPNIAQLYQILQNKDHLFLVTEHVSRGQLFEHILSNQKLTEFQACKFLQQLLDAVQYIHSLGVAHRDLKPENILLDYKFNVKLIDFGLSNIYSKQEYLRSACGSPCYAPPQMLCGKPYYGLKADIWSLGIILYAMCFGYLPFDNPNTNQLYKSITHGQYDLPDHASNQLRSILSIILEKDPQKRASIDQIRSHPFCKFSPLKLTPGIIVGLSDIPYEQDIQQQIVEEIYCNKILTQLDKEQLRRKLKQSIKFNKHNQLSATYYLILQRNLRAKNETVINYYTKKNNLINRYSIAQKVKQIYEKRLKQRLQNTRIKHQVEKSWQNKKVQRSTSKNQANTHKKQMLNVVELYNKSQQKQSLKNQRRLKTTATKRRKDMHAQDKMFKKTKLNFNQIKLVPEKQLNQITHNLQNQRSRRSKDKNVTQRVRNKSLAINRPIQKSKSSDKKFSHAQKKQFSSKKKRVSSQAEHYKKISNFNTQKSNQKNKRLSRKEYVKYQQNTKKRNASKHSKMYK